MKQIEDDKTIDKIDVLMSIDEHHDDLEEAHYIHTINDVVELMLVYGLDVVMDDIKSRLKGVTSK